MGVSMATPNVMVLPESDLACLVECCIQKRLTEQGRTDGFDSLELY